jgi:hypothetical protein
MNFARWFLVLATPAALALAFVAVACSNSGDTLDAGQDAGVEASGDAVGRDARDAGADGVADAGQPYLTALSVVATASAEGGGVVALVPTFAPDIFDYYVRCAAGSNELTVSVTASKGSSSLLTQPIVSPSLPMQTLSIDVLENQAIVAAASNATATTEYWVRCLPHDMSPLQWTPHPDAGVPTPGYYLVGNWFPSTGEGGYAIVLDNNGVPVWYARAPSPLGTADVDDVVPGAVSFYPFARTANEPFDIYALSPLAMTTVEPGGYATSMHELRFLPSGDYLVFSTPFTYGVDLTGLTVPLPDGGKQALGPDSIIQDCAIVRFTAGGTVVSVWLGSEHFDAALDSTFPTLAFSGVTAPDGGEVVDPFHCNSIDVDPANGNLLVSARNMDSIFYIDTTAGAILWKMGGAAFTNDNAVHISAKSPFFRQHDARLLPGWSSTCNGGTGQISVFDDEYDRKPPARGVVYDIVVGGADGGPPPDGGCGDAGVAPGTAAEVWEFQGSENSVLGGSFRISSDGSRIIGWGRGGAPNLVFTEVDVQGHDLLDFYFMDSEDSSYRAIKVPTSAFEIGVLRSTAAPP